jgi:Bacterial SH3 domain
MATAAAAAVEWSSPDTSHATAQAAPVPAPDRDRRDAEEEVVSRASVRQPVAPTPTLVRKPEPKPTPTPEPVPEVVADLYATAGLNVRTGPGEEYDVVAVLETGDTIGVTGTETDGWAEVVYDEAAHWVSAEYLSEDKPEPEEEESETGGISAAPCPDGSSVESGLTPDAIRVHRAVCAEFPDVSSYLGLRPGDGGEHGTGQAIDIMISSSSLGGSIADYVRSNYQALGVSEVIWAQQIWTVERSSDGWRPMEDRGSATANHYDHVHVTVYGDSGTT